MVKVTFKPWNEIVIHEVVKYETVDKFVEQKCSGLPKGFNLEPLLWVDGIVFLKVVMPPSPEVIKEQLQGIVHYQSVEYAPMEKFEPSIATQDGVIVPIIDVSRTKALKDVAVALKAQ